MEKLSWQTTEYLHTKKTNDWYWIVSIVTISIAIIAVIFSNLIFAILIVIASFTLSLFASRKPEIMDVSIDASGATVGKDRYPYRELESFWVETRDVHPRLFLKSKKIFMPYIIILLEHMDPEEIKEWLEQYLPEEEHSEPLLEKILLYLGF